MAKKLKSILILLIGLGLAYWFVNRVDWQMVGVHLRNARIWPLVVGALLVNITILMRSLRWQAFLAPIARVSLRNVIAATSIGFGGLFVIGRAGSEIIRPAVLSLRERLQPSATLATILIERIYDTTAVVLLFALALMFLQLPADRTATWDKLGGTRTVGVFLLLALLTGIIMLVVLRLKAEPIINWLQRATSRLPQKLAQPLLNLVRHLADGLSVLLNLRELALSIFYTACVWALVSFSTWLTLYAFRETFSLGHVLFILGFGLMGSLIPTPGGSAGAFHVAAAKGLEFVGLEPNKAASIAIVYHLIAFGPPFVLGLYYLIRDDISFGQLREMIASENSPPALVKEGAGRRSEVRAGQGERTEL